MGKWTVIYKKKRVVAVSIVISRKGKDIGKGKKIILGRNIKIERIRNDNWKKTFE